MDKDLKKIPKPESKDFMLEDIGHVNYDPHPYVITPKHIAWASDHNGGMLTGDSIRDAEKAGQAHCGFKERGKHLLCEVPYDQHTSDRALFIKALVDKPINRLKGLKKYLLSIKQVLLDLKIDGVAFIASK